MRRLYPLYSITKTFISTVILKLAEENKLKLDQKTSDWVTDAPEGDKYSLRQLLNNTSGLPDYFMQKSYRDEVTSHPGRPWTRQQYIQNTYTGKLLYEPGRDWLYSNLGYMFLKDTIEKATGKSLAQAFADMIFQPLDLRDCRVLQECQDFLDLVPGTPDIRGSYHPGWVAHGVIASSATDVAKFYQRLFAGEIISPSSLKEMQTLVRVPGVHPPAVSPSYGLGVMGDPDGPFGENYGHGGGGPGYALHATYWAEINNGLVTVALTNLEEAPMLVLMNELAQFFLPRGSGR